MSEKKYYVVGATSPEGWERVHSVLMQDGTLDDNIPTRSVECTDLKEHSPTRAVYLLTDEEAAQLTNHPDIRFAHLDTVNYRDQFPPRPDEFHTIDRYATTVKNYRDLSVGYPNPTTSADINRAGYQILRGTSYANSWTTAASIVNSVVPNVTGTGEDVDVIVGDDGCWFGHVEFANNTGNGPSNYKWANSGNVLSSTGTCDVLDLVLDSPYYIDPAWFNASPGTRLTTRWDGTVVPTEAEARAWWGNASNRSAQFASAGTVTIPSYYTRANCNGSDTVISVDGDHGTACCGQTFGRTFGWAYNANKWFIDAIGGNGVWPVDNYFDIVKIFHQTKPVNPTYGNKNPTVSSNSWGYRETQGSSGYYYFRQGNTGSGGVAYTSKPAFMGYLGSTGDGGRFKGEMLPNNLTVAGDELIAAGVIFVVAAGNSNQQQVGSSHPNFDNYWAASAGTPLSSAYHLALDGISYCYNTTSRRGFPQHIGMYTTGSTVVYPAINIGALDDSYTLLGLERKVNYSDMGDQIDVFTPGDGTLTSCRTPYGIQYPRHDQRVGGLTSYDTRFSGTSSACPTAAGMIATALQYNRTWTWQDVRTWLHGLTPQSASTFYIGTEPTTATDSNWSDLNGLQGGTARVLYNNIAATTATTSITSTVLTNFISLTKDYINAPVIPLFVSGGTSPYTYAVNPALPTGATFSTTTGAIAGTPTVLHSASAFSITVTDSTATSSTGTVTLEVVNSLTTTLVIPTITLIKDYPIVPFTPVTAGGGTPPYTWSNGPGGTQLIYWGLSLNTSTGQISGTPNYVIPSSAFNIRATDSGGRSTYETVYISIVNTSTTTLLTTTLAIPSISLQVLTAMTPATPVTASGGTPPYAYAVSPTLPTGLSINASSGAISGTPTVLKNPTVYSITVTDQGSQTSSKNVTLSVLAASLSAVVNNGNLAFYAYQSITPVQPVSASGGSGSITYSVSPALPTGLTFNASTGVISGTPTQVESTTIHTVTVADQYGQSASADFNLSVSSVPIIVQTLTPIRTLTIYEPVTPFTPISATGGSGTITYSLDQLLPTGMTLNTSTGEISGTPTFGSGSKVYTMIATDQVGQQASITFVIRIRSNLPLVFTDEQNLIWNELNALMGNTSTGYGTGLISAPVSPGQKIYADDFDLMIEDIGKIIIHQYGAGTTATNLAVSRLRYADPGDPITIAVPQRLWTELQFLKASPLTVHPSNLKYMTVNTPVQEQVTIDTTSTGTIIGLSSVDWISNTSNGSANAFVNAIIYAWTRLSDANYFFNSGGRIQPLIELVSISGNEAEEALWQQAVDQATQVVFGRTEYEEALANNGVWEQYFYEDDQSNLYTRTVILSFTIAQGQSIVGNYYRSVTASCSFEFTSPGKKKKKKKNKKGKGYSANLDIKTSFRTRYAVGDYGGISSPRPQAQKSNGLMSAARIPIAPFSIGIDGIDDNASATVILQNNSTQTCIITNISLTPDPLKYPQSAYPELYPGYPYGTIDHTGLYANNDMTLAIDPFDSKTFTVTYTGTQVGHYRGYIFIESTVNDLVLFTEVNVGQVTPASWIATATNINTISQDFNVNLSNGLYKGFTATVTGSHFSLSPTSRSTFRVNFDPRNTVPSTYYSTATVYVVPADPINSRVRVDLPLAITCGVFYQHLGGFLSAIGLDNNILGLSYDVIGGERYLTVGIGASTPIVDDGAVVFNELRNESLVFNSWAEVYRMKLSTSEEVTHYLNSSTCVKSYDFSEGRSVSSFFRANRTESSLLNIHDYGTGDLRIDMNNIKDFVSIDENELKTLLGIQNAFFYYDETVNRITQLEYPANFVDGHKTQHFVGFRRNGSTILSLVNPNLLP